jgi:hypothetical protein
MLRSIHTNDYPMCGVSSMFVRVSDHGHAIHCSVSTSVGVLNNRSPQTLEQFHGIVESTNG